MKLRISSAVVGALLLATACNAGTTPTTTSRLTPSTSTTSTTATSTEATSTTTTVPATSSTTAPLPANSQDYAIGAFDAWVAGDTALLSRLVADDALETLELSDPSANWQFQRCEGAAGSAYCTWQSEAGRLTFRVGNEAASVGEEDAIQEVLTE